MLRCRGRRRHIPLTGIPPAHLTNRSTTVLLFSALWFDQGSMRDGSTPCPFFPSTITTTCAAWAGSNPFDRGCEETHGRYIRVGRALLSSGQRDIAIPCTFVSDLYLPPRPALTSLTSILYLKYTNPLTAAPRALIPTPATHQEASQPFRPVPAAPALSTRPR